MFRNFMQGRYGNDQLNLAFMAGIFVCGLLSIIFSGLVDLILMLAELVLVALWIFRAFSKNISDRRRENESFLKFWNKFKNSKFSQGIKKAYVEAENFFKRLFDRKHKYFKCPNCKARLRVPRGRGEITITCPRCKVRFDKKS